MPETADPLVLKELVPPAALGTESFRQLARQVPIETLPAGGTLFRAGDQDRRTYYLLSGEVALLGEDGSQTVVRVGTEPARHPLSNQRPRQHTARARTAIRYLGLDSDLLDIYLTWNQLAGIEVNELSTDEGTETGGDWMTRILQSKAFVRIPPANIQRMFMRLEEVGVRAGETVIRQGEQGDYYFIISRGRCRVTRSSASGRQVTLAELGPGDSFGEEALIAEAKRNATVTMLTDGVLMRLSKADFDELLRAPMQKEVEFEAARAMVRDGAVLLDVRLESEHRGGSIRGSLNLPIYMLRLKADSLDPGRRYVVYCDTGRRSSAAAYLLTERGFEAYVLRGGLLSVHQARADALQRDEG